MCDVCDVFMSAKTSKRQIFKPIFSMSKQYVNPSQLFDSVQHGFSQIVVTNPGKLVFISGQVAWDAQKQIVSENFETQTRKAFENVQIAIEKAGGTLSDIVMLRLYIVNYNEEKGQAVGSVLREFFGTETPPASTWISVNGLANKDFLLEIEAQGIINERKNPQRSAKSVSSAFQ